MTTTPAAKAVRPKLNTANWTLPRDAPGTGSEELSPLSPGHSSAEYSWEQKESPGHGRNAPEVPPGSINISIPPLVTQSRDSMGSMSSDMLEELRKIIKEEVAQVAQVVQLKNSETGTPLDTLRFSPLSSQNSVFTPSYPSPPPSVTETLNTSKVSSPRDRSPEVAHAKVTPTPPLAHPSTSIPPSLSQSTPPISPQQKAVRFRNRGPPVIHCQPRVEPEPVSPTAAATPQVELSSVDKAWGMLFDAEGFPTQRLNSVLRGLANFMIAEFGSPDSLVVTPEKMLVLYTKYKVELERFQYEDIFKSRSKDALERIEFLYQDLDCQYHLIQGAPRSHPNVPGLTPIGFAKWMVSNILAYPDPEARRLHAIMSEQPINADGPLVDGKSERLPKQLSRHLFPEHYDKKVRKILDEAMWDCLEDVAPPLPAIPRARPTSSSDNARPPEANAHHPRRPVPAPHRSRTYDRGGHRVEPHPARLPRANSDAGASLPRHHRDLPPPPMGRHSVSQPRPRSPPPMNRYTASLPAISHHHAGLPSPSAQFAAFSSDLRGGEGNYGVYPGRDARGDDSRDQSPRSPGLGRRGLGAADRGPTWEELYSRNGPSSGRGSSVDTGSQRSFR